MKAGFEYKWSEVRQFILNKFGNHLDGDSNDFPCFYCPECEEPLYKDEFPYFKSNRVGYPICPICENVLG